MGGSPSRSAGWARDRDDRRPPADDGRGAPLHGIDYALPVASAQVKSAILLAGLYADGGRRSSSRRRRATTPERMLAAGAGVSVRPTSVTVRPADRLALGDVEVPGDFSSGGAVRRRRDARPRSGAPSTASTSTRGDRAAREILERMGAKVTVYNRPRDRRRAGGDLEVRSARSSARGSTADEVPLAIDELPLFALAAAMRARRERRPARRSCARRRPIASRRPSTRCARGASAHGRATTASPSPACRRGSGAGACRAAATTGSRCSAPSRASRRARRADRRRRGGRVSASRRLRHGGR